MNLDSLPEVELRLPCFDGKHRQRRQRTEPAFPDESFWIVVLQNKTDSPGTKNPLKNWDNASGRSLKLLTTQSKLVATLQKEQNLSHLMMEKVVAGDAPQDKRKKYQNLGELLRLVTSYYEMRDIK